MGRAGKPATPTAVLKERGSGQAKRRKSEPVPPAWDVVPPYRFLKATLAEWDRLVPILQEMGTLTVADADALAELCELNVSIRQLEKDIRKKGRIVIGSAGTEKGSPLVGQLRDEKAQRLRLLKEFGLTPASRTGQNVSEARLDQINGSRRKITDLIKGSSN